MKMEISRLQLAGMLAKQLNTFFPGERNISGRDLLGYLDLTLARLQSCFIQMRDKAFCLDGVARFDCQHTDQYAMFLYLFGRTVFESGNRSDIQLAKKAYALNKALHALDAFYEIELPEAFLFVHAVGTVLGRAQYGNYFVVYHGCTVGADGEKKPRIGDGVVMFGHSAIIGNSHVERDSAMGYGSVARNFHVSSCKVVHGQSPHNAVVTAKEKYLKRFFIIP